MRLPRLSPAAAQRKWKIPIHGSGMFCNANGTVSSLDAARILQRVAGLIQQRVLPRALPMLPGWSLHAYHKPVNTPGQDFYDTMLLEDGQLMLVIGHVAEEGLAAAHARGTVVLNPAPPPTAACGEAVASTSSA